jgi:hypothetical protein
MAQALSEHTRLAIRNSILGFETMTQPEQEDAAILAIARNLYWYCERNLMIQDKVSGEIVPFTLNWAQKKLVDLVMADIAAGRPVRYIILKARQMGFSTVIEALGYWWTATHKHVKTVIIAHESEASGNLYEMFRRYFEHSHPSFQPDRKYNSKKELVFDVEDNVKEEYKAKGETPPGLASQIKTMVAKPGKGRSSTIHFFHGSEVAHWEKGADVKSAALQAIPRAPNTFAFLESTANGVGGYYYDEWQFAKKGESTFKALFFAWHEHDEYEEVAPVGGIVQYDDEELDLMELFREKGYPEESWDRKIMWRREKKKDFRSDPKLFYQEYPSTDMEAFLASGRPVFDVQMLTRMEREALKHKPKFGTVMPNPDVRSKQKYVFHEVPVSFEGQDPTPLKVWDLPRNEEEKFTIAIDVSEGLEVSSTSGKTLDWSVIDVMRQADLKTVARWRGHIDPDLLGEVAYGIGTLYNTALIAPEINNHGIAVAQSLRNKFYRNLYMRETSEDEAFQERTTKFGWLTNRKTKPVIINNLVKAIREGDIIDYDIVFVREGMTYVRDDQGHTSAQEGMFDDTIMAKAINLQMSDFNSVSAQYAKEHIQKPIKRNTNVSRTNAIEEIAAGRPRPRLNGDAVARRRASRAAHRIRRQPRG